MSAPMHDCNVYVLEPQPAPPEWPRLLPKERTRTLQAMQRHGGGFVRELAGAWMRGDEIMAARLGQAFNDLVLAYGPGSPPYAATREAA